MNLKPLQYPIGRFQKPNAITTEHLEKWISTILKFPSELESLILKLTEEELSKTYRPNGWTIRQLVHHCADSHMNAFIRFKLALTEDSPTIKPYYESRWAELPDTLDVAPQVSLLLLEGLHKRWSVLLENLESAHLNRKYIHPEHGQSFTLAETIGMYDWHCRHHLAHVRCALNS